MKKIEILMIKPCPPSEILSQKCPIPDSKKYKWAPINLKLIAHTLMSKFNDSLSIKIFHLVSDEDTSNFVRILPAYEPDIILFTEIDILVNQVNALAISAKLIHPSVITIVGGKQSSLLRKGDVFPFEGIDYAIRGDGPVAMIEIISAFIENRTPVFKGRIDVDDCGIVYDDNSFSVRNNCFPPNLSDMSNIPIANHSYEEYFTVYQDTPSILPDGYRTAPLLIGTGCPHKCIFCQSPNEYGKKGIGKAILNDVDDTVKEIVWLKNQYNVNNFFSLEPNMDLQNLKRIFIELDKWNVDKINISGFVRAGDIVRFKKDGTLDFLVKRGLRVLLIGLDIPMEDKKDIFNKKFTFQSMMDCLEICRQSGILVFSTFVGLPDCTAESLTNQLQLVRKLPVAHVDVRLAIALRNTQYFKDMEEYLIFHPDTNKRYFDRQNYRYQTLQIPGMITPEETYSIVNEFNESFNKKIANSKYAEEMVRQFPEVLPLFDRLHRTYTGKTISQKLKHHEFSFSTNRESSACFKIMNSDQ